MPVYKSECLQCTSNFATEFKMIIMDTHKLCDANINQQIMLTVFQYKESGKHTKVAMGYVELE
jgi:predicted nucleic acid-binding Zn ribbon protein